MPTGAEGCPRCGYVRKAGDSAPGWQCPACGVAIEKYRELHAGPTPPVPSRVAHWREAAANEPLGGRFASAAPDLCTAALFLWCWMSPGGWRAPLLLPLGTVMLMQFFVIHSNIFLISTVGQEEASAGARGVAALIIMAFYVPVAGAVAIFYGGWWPFWTFAALLLGRVVSAFAATGSGAYQAKRLRFQWAHDGVYVLGGLIAAFAPMPSLGLRDHARLGAWLIPPENVMAWGVIAFGVAGVAKLVEQRAWIEDWDETPPAPSSDA